MAQGLPKGMMQQLQQMQTQILQAQDELKDATVTSSAGGGVIEITITGDQVVKSVVIKPELLEDADVDLLQDLMLAAFNKALEDSRQMAADKLGPLAGGGLPF